MLVISQVNLQQFPITINLEGYQQLYPLHLTSRFKSTEQNAEDAGSEKCKFHLQADSLSSPHLFQLSRGCSSFTNLDLYLFHALIVATV